MKLIQLKDLMFSYAIPLFIIAIIINIIGCRNDDDDSLAPFQMLSKIAYQKNIDSNPHIFVFDEKGSEQLTFELFSGYGNFGPKWSHDGTKIIYSENSPTNTDLYIMDADGSNGILFMDSICYGYCNLPDFSPNGEKIVLLKNSQYGIYTVHVGNSDGTNIQPLPDTQLSYYPDWSPDSRKIVFQQQLPSILPTVSQRDIIIINEDGTGLLNITNSNDPRLHEEQPTWSPDGSKIAFVRREYNISTLNYIEVNTGMEHFVFEESKHLDIPSWSPNGEYLVFGNEKGIQIIKIDGSNQQLLIEGGRSPDWLH